MPHLLCPPSSCMSLELLSELVLFCYNEEPSGETLIKVRYDDTHIIHVHVHVFVNIEHVYVSVKLRIFSYLILVKFDPYSTCKVQI